MKIIDWNLMNKKTITVTYSTGEADEFSINENLDETLLQEILSQLDMQDWDDIYGDVLTINNQNNEEEEGF